MGIWSFFRYTYNPGATIDTGLLSPASIDWINSKLEHSPFNDGEDRMSLLTKSSGVMNFRSLLERFTDCSRIWGYITEEVTEILDNIASAVSELCTIVFSCDGNVQFYAIRLDPETRRATLLIIDELQNGSIGINMAEYGYCAQLISLLEMDKVHWVTYKESTYYKRGADFANELSLKNHAILNEPGLVELIMSLNGY